MKHLSILTISCMLLAGCSLNSGHYERFMDNCVSGVMEYHHSESDAREVCHCAAIQAQKKPKTVDDTDEVIAEIVNYCLNEYVEKRAK